MKKHRPVSKLQQAPACSRTNRSPSKAPRTCPPVACCHHKQSRGLYLDILFTPDFSFAMQRIAGNSSMPAHFRTTIPALIGLCAPPPISPAKRFFYSVSPFPKILPFARAKHAPELCRFFAAISSICLNRMENFAFAFFSAISGSTSRNLAKFTEANSRYPISSSVRLVILRVQRLAKLLRPPHSSCRTRLQRCSNQIKSAPRAE